MNVAAIGLALLMASCGGNGIESASEGRSERGGDSLPGATTTPSASVVRPFCGAEAEERIRAAHPELPACLNRAYVFVEAQVAGGELLVLGHDADPCCTDVPSPGTDIGAHVFRDGAPVSAADPLNPGPGRLSGEQAVALMSAELLRLFVTHQALDPVAVGALRESWPVTAAVLAAHPPGSTQTEQGWQLRLASESREVERGVTCHSLAIWEAEIRAGAIHTHRIALYSEGSSMGSACPGEPFPAR